MPVDNMICIQKRNDRYWVWMGLIQDKVQAPAKSDAKFLLIEDARQYAKDWLKEAHVQFGIWELKDL